MDGWISQWYVNVPASSNRCVDVAPRARTPESQRPSSDVQVWGAPSSFVTVTSVPRAICSGSGEKRKPLIRSAALSGAGAEVVGGFVDGLAGAVVVVTAARAGGVVGAVGAVVAGGAVPGGADVVGGAAAGAVGGMVAAVAAVVAGVGGPPP